MNHIEAAKQNTIKWPQYKRSESLATTVVALRNIGKVGGANWLKKGDITLGFFDREGRAHVFSQTVGSWCIISHRAHDKIQFVGE